MPVDRIQNVDLVQNPLHRMLRVAEVRVETASGTEPEATLRVLSMADVAKLRSEIFARRRAVVDSTDTAAESPSAAAGTGKFCVPCPADSFAAADTAPPNPSAASVAEHAFC